MEWIKVLGHKIFRRKNHAKNLDLSLSLLKLIAHKFQTAEFLKDPKNKYVQIVVLFFNRLIIDISAIRQLVQTGHYGSARTLVAVTMRNLRMFASLIDAETERIDRFWDEDELTYQTDRGFKNDFNENKSKRIAQELFGENAFNEIELEKSLHGSGHALRKFYTDRAVINGLRIPIVKLDVFKNDTYAKLLYLLADGFVLDFLGVFFTKFKDHPQLQAELDAYLKLANRAKKTNEKHSREGSLVN